MYNDHLTREQAIELVGLLDVEEVDNTCCLPTSRLQPEWDNTREYKASILTNNKKYESLSAWYFPKEEEFWNSYYYPNIKPEDDEQIEDEGMIDWDNAFGYYTID